MQKISLMTIIIFGVVLIVISVIVVVILTQGNKAGPPSNSALHISPLQKSTIGQIPNTDLTTLPNFIKSEKKEDQTIWSYRTHNPFRSDEVITNNQGFVVFEKITIPENNTTTGSIKISTFIQQHGEAERTIQGSADYGPFSNTYVYAGKGFTVIANPSTGTVQEIQLYQPLSVDEYLKTYGGTIETEHVPE